MSLEAWGDEGDMDPPDGYVTEEIYDEMVVEKDAKIKALRDALEYIDTACSDFPKPSGYNLSKDWVDLADRAITMISHKTQSAMSVLDSTKEGE